MSASTDHRVRVTKMLIRRAFTELLRIKPISSISIKELCERAGINRGTFYTHYTDIYDLLRQIEEDMYQELERALQPLLTTDALSIQISTTIFQCLKDNSDLCTVTLGDYGDKAFATRLLSLGRARYLESLPRNVTATDLEIEYYYAFVSAGCIGLLRRWLDDGMIASVEEIAELVEGIMARGRSYFDGERGRR